MTCQNDQRMTLENQTRQSLKTIGVKELSFKLQRCNANVLLKKISNALSGQAKCPDS